MSSFHRFQKTSRLRATHFKPQHGNSITASKPLQRFSSQLYANFSPQPCAKSLIFGEYQQFQLANRYINCNSIKIASKICETNEMSLGKYQMRSICSLASNDFKFDLNGIASSRQKRNQWNAYNRKNKHLNSIICNQKRYLRPQYSAPSEAPDYSKRHPHSYYGEEPNQFQKGMLHLSKKTSYADVVLYIVSYSFIFFFLFLLISSLITLFSSQRASILQQNKIPTQIQRIRKNQKQPVTMPTTHGFHISLRKSLQKPENKKRNKTN